MSVSSTQSTVADYFFVTGLRDVDLLSTYDSVKNGQDTDADATYYNNQENCAAATTTPDAASPTVEHPPIVSKLPRTPPPTTVNNSDQQSTLASTGRKRGQSLPVLPTTMNTNGNNIITSVSTGTSAQPDSLTRVMDHVQAVIDHFDKERDVARGSVISIPTPPTPPGATTATATATTTTAASSLEKSRRASVNSGYLNRLEKRSSVHDTSWQRVKDSITSSGNHSFIHSPTRPTLTLTNSSLLFYDTYKVKRTHTQRRQRQYSLSQRAKTTTGTTSDTSTSNEQQKVQLSNTAGGEDQPTIPHLLDVKYPPTVLMRYPSQDSQIPFPSYLSMVMYRAVKNGNISKTGGACIKSTFTFVVLFPT